MGQQYSTSRPDTPAITVRHTVGGNNRPSIPRCGGESNDTHIVGHEYKPADEAKPWEGSEPQDGNRTWYLADLIL